MADVENGYLRSNVVSGTPSPLPRPYLPSIPPQKTFKPSYSRFLVAAPFSALAGVVADAREPPKPPLLPRSRNRIQVGSTNRWRLPNSLGSDLLGSSQAVKAVTSYYNDTLLAIMTADNPMTTCNSEFSPDRLLRVQPHSIVSTRLLKSQPAPTMSRSPRGSDRHLIQSQPVLPSESQSFRSNATIRDQSTLWERPVRPTPNQLRQIDYQKNFLSPGMRSPTPMEMFLFRSQTVNAHKAPDVIIYALDTSWELHKPFVQKSALLSSLVRRAEQTGMHNIDEEEENDTQNITATVGGMSLEALKTAASGTKQDLAASSNQSLSRRQSSFADWNKILTLKLRIRDPLITKHSFARALAALYEMDNEIKVQESDAVGVLAAAHFLSFATLEKVCSEVMLDNIAAWSVCAFHAAASKYKQVAVAEACEKWLELNLVPQLLVQIFLSHLPQDLLEKTLKSTRLFTWSEYSIYKLLSYWIFLQQHSTIQLMPSWGTVVTWFMSLPKTSSFVEREEGHGYLSLFRVLRIDGITDSSQLDELQKMNVVPQSWLLRVYSQHYHALQGGGDMSLMTRFEQGAIRHGFIIEQQLHYHSEIMSLHGFHFEVKAVREDSDSVYSFHIERLRPNDPVLSFRACERHTFSMRQDREVRYCMRIQWMDGDIYKTYNTGVLCQGFGFSGKSKRSETMTVENAQMPLYVTVCLMFPPS